MDFKTEFSAIEAEYNRLKILAEQAAIAEYNALLYMEECPFTQDALTAAEAAYAAAHEARPIADAAFDNAKIEFDVMRKELARRALLLVDPEGIVPLLLRTNTQLDIAENPGQDI